MTNFPFNGDLEPDKNYQVHDENAEIALKEVGAILDKAMPKGYGFIFLMTTYGKGGNTFYISNVQRPDVINMMQEWIASNGGQLIDKKKLLAIVEAAKDQELPLTYIEKEVNEL